MALQCTCAINSSPSWCFEQCTANGATSCVIGDETYINVIIGVNSENLITSMDFYGQPLYTDDNNHYVSETTPENK